MLSKESTIMLVDDSRLIRSAIKKHLTKLGYENFIEASDGQEAIDMHSQSPADFIFMDIVMPSLNGDEALVKIRESDKNTPVVMLSSVSKEQVIKECAEQGILGYILKPIAPQDGPQTLEKFLAMV